MTHPRSRQGSATSVGARAALPNTDDMVWIPGGTYAMGSNHHYPEEAPVHHVTVSGFWIERHAVTNTQYARFVDATGYVTVAEIPPDPRDYPDALPGTLVPGAVVFLAPPGPVDLRDFRNWWQWVPGADWRHPEGPGSSIDGRADHPVVHMALADVQAYARWAGRSLPTEAEAEFAARGGLEGAEFAWGDDFMPGGSVMANTWHGEFPWQRQPVTGFERTAPVGSFPPNGYGLLDMIGNVWEWTDDWYRAGHQADAEKACCVPANPRGPSKHRSHDPSAGGVAIPRKVLKGGSFLCADNYCRRYRPAARMPQAIDSGTSNVGFRCVLRAPGPASPD